MSGGQVTPTQTVGPFFHFCLADDLTLGQMAPEGTPGERIRLRVRVLDADGAAVPDSLIELYQADAAGRYATAADAGGFSGFGRMPTDDSGTCVFETVRPGRVGGARPQAAHIEVCVLARGLLSHLFTRIYFAGDPDLATDTLLGQIPEARRGTLQASPDPADPGLWLFDIRLQGDGETVFFLP
jgi:protocatechuate 3,4-dioxygenase, alpha subunit